MACSTGSHPYTFQKPSAMATRTLVSDTKPAETASASSNDLDAHGKPVLTRKTTDNYEQAAAAAAKAGTGTGPGQTVGLGAVSGTDRPGGLDRQQSWSMSDAKRQHHEQLLGGQPNAQGYASTQK
ncbi:hypothetical protein LTR36_007358 [Oleoguttula mirabilis]|uniref:SMP domain-containing protein n=1 Tax=Oleoguttula mirabilis TaxID=1507867 RepID=A0AAV9JA63_9PEZI|nr:hypothetical protein LTR36_007358 [Oleoguttula mirabilis]